MISKFIIHNGLKKYFANTSWLFLGKIVRMVVGLFIGIWVARYLGPSQYGLLSYAQAFVGLFSPIATLGLDTIVVRDLVQDENKSHWLPFFLLYHSRNIILHLFYTEFCLY